MDIVGREFDYQSFERIELLSSGPISIVKVAHLEKIHKILILKRKSKFLEIFPQDAYLSEVRKLLSERFHRYKFGPEMRSNCHFEDPKYGIVRDEDKILLTEIAHESAIKIVLNYPDLHEFAQRSEYGFKITDKGSERARKKSSSIKKYTDIKGYPKPDINIRCKNHIDHLCARNLVDYLADYLADSEETIHWLSICLGIEKKDLEGLNNNSFLPNNYKILERPMAHIIVEDIIISPELKQEIKKAVDNKHSISKQREKLRKISEEFGQFYSEEIILGGKIVQQKNTLTDSTSSNRNVGSASKLIPTSDEFCIIIGGSKETSHKDHSESEWLKSLIRDPQTWEIIGYKKISPIFNLLQENDEEQRTLKQKVLKALGID
ncbi:4595_t:CDS:2 [Acaulospora morrowiae]|uniref:4595_t:CDS:1 n=1 Tax=Acaulospora morrowiae TaxID=94023 RepID=A0A9N9F0F7_9GLOM|nr:4595_t:CDS:2 [Acaulospora morrowiae]